MKLKVVVDNNTYIDQYYYGEPGVCYYIEDNDTKLLLDVGYSDIFLKNAKLLHLDLNEISTIVISHGHDDHSRGLKYFFEQYNKKKIKIVAHPSAFNEKIIDDLKIGSPMSEMELREKSNLILSEKPVQISGNITFLGEIPRLNDFEIASAIGKQKVNGNYVDDLLFDDSAIVYRTAKGIYVITGCSHSGICNIIEYAKKITNEERVLGVLGGFHLFDLSPRLEKTIEYFQKNHIKNLYPCHCVSFQVKAEIHKHIPIQEVGVGLEVNW